MLKWTWTFVTVSQHRAWKDDVCSVPEAVGNATDLFLGFAGSVTSFILSTMAMQELDLLIMEEEEVEVFLPINGSHH